MYTVEIFHTRGLSLYTVSDCVGKMEGGTSEALDTPRSMIHPVSLRSPGFEEQSIESPNADLEKELYRDRISIRFFSVYSCEEYRD